MAHQKPSDFIKHKFKSLKTYASTEWLADSKKKYRQVFDRGETTYIYAEFAFFNKLFDEEDWEAQINLKAFVQPKDRRQKAKELCDINAPKSISKDQNIVYVREGWGNDKPGKFWVEGTYYWEAYIDDVKVGTQRFYVYDVGKVTADENPYISIEQVRLYEGGNTDGNAKDPKFYSEFNGKDTRFIWIEFKAINKLNKPWNAELIFNFYNDARQLKGRTVELKKVTKSQNSFTVTSGWGSDHKGTWFPDNYTVEIVFMDTLIGIVPFTVGTEFMEGETNLLKPDDSGAGLVGVPAQPDLDSQSLRRSSERFGWIDWT